jgi:hypothetical protein
MKRPSKSVQWLILAAILALAAGLRLGRLGLVEFKFDEATTARSALAIARREQLPTVGMVSSRGPRNPALMSYVLAPALAIAPDPRVAAGWLAFLGTVAVGVTYWLGNEYLGWPVGAFAAAMFAASPWAVFLSRKIWAQNLPLLSLGFVAALLAVVARKRPWALAGALAAAAGLLSLHLGGMAFFFIGAAALVLFPRQVRPAPLVVGIALVLLILSPYLVHDALHGWQNLRAFGRIGAGGAVTDLQALSVAGRITGGLGLESLAGERHAEFSAGLPRLQWLDLAEIGLTAAGLVWSLASVIGARLSGRALTGSERARIVLGCWFIVPVILLSPRQADVQPHALSLLYPVQHLFAALFIVDTIKAVRTRLGVRWASVAAAAAVGLAMATVGWQGYTQQRMLDFVDAHDTPGGFGAPAKYAIAAARRAGDLRQQGDGPIAALLPGGDVRYDGQAAAFSVLLPADSRLVDGTRALVLPDIPTVFLVAPGAEPGAALLAGLADQAAQPARFRTGSPEEYRFFRWEPLNGERPLADVGVEGARWESGVTLTGYAWDGDAKPGGAIAWRLVFAPDGPPAQGSDLHWFNHLVDSEGRRWGQADGVGYPAGEWRAGDWVATWFDLSISVDAPAPPYYVRVGLYTYPEVANLSLLDEAGNLAGQFLELGPVGSGSDG